MLGKRSLVSLAAAPLLLACPSDTVSPNGERGDTGSATSGDTSESTGESDTNTNTDTDTGDTGCEEPCECVADADCAVDEICEAGECVPESAQPECGNSIVELGEECDAGAQNGPGQACLDECVINVCGDGDPGPGEGCDDGNDVDDDACSNECVLASCGDGAVAAEEECDDGNLVDDDGCTNACTLPSCGDGIVSEDEGCDDGAFNSDHADCTNSCELAFCGDGQIHDDGEGVEQCDSGDANGPGQSCLDGCILNVCGDADLGPGEGCDDGNNEPGDGCNDVCALESCGNAVVDFGEACDDGNAVNDDDCSNACTLPTCGDAIVQAGEACDLGNLNSNTGSCTVGCTLAECGDGLIWAGQEQCDNGDNNANDAACKADCTTQICGDGFVGLDEGCDDGNLVQDDGCTNACKLPECGDGIVQEGEACDQGVNNGQGECSLSCTIPPCGCGEYHNTPFTCADQFPNIIFVEVGGNGSGACWDDTRSLLDALMVAQPGDALWVKAGTYKPGPMADRSLSFEIPAGVSVYGGFAGVETTLAQRNWNVNHTILSGDIDGNGYMNTAQAQLDSYHVARIPNGTGVRLDGVRVRGGYANGAGVDSEGAGVHIALGNPTIANSLFEYNFSLNRGRAIHVAAGSTEILATNLASNLNIGFSPAGAIGVANGASVHHTGGNLTGGASGYVGMAWVDAGGTLVLEDLTGSWNGRGALVYGGTLSVLGCDFQTGRVAEMQGGSLDVIGGSFGPGVQAFYLDSAIANFDGATLQGHAGATEGGAIYGTDSTVTITGVNFLDNAVNINAQGNAGAAVYLWYSDLQITNSVFTNNSNGNSALYSRGGTASVQNCDFQDNVNSGGLTMRDGTLTVLDSTFSDNQKSGVHNYSAEATIRDSTFVGNANSLSGGAIRSSGQLDVESCTLIDNSGGAIFHADLNEAPVRVDSSVFIGNTSSNAGGALRADYSTTVVANCLFSGNTASARGGAIFTSQGHMIVHDSSFANNASPEGGALTSVLSIMEAYNSVFWGDSSVIFEDAGVSKTFAQVCSPENLAGVGNVTIAGSPYTDVLGTDAMAGTDDDDLHLGGLWCTQAGDPSLRPADALDLDDDGNTLELLPFDLDGGPRVSAPQMERGAYED